MVIRKTVDLACPLAILSIFQAATIYDEFIRGLSLNGIMFNLVVGFTEITRLVYGPLPSLWCTIPILLRRYAQLEIFMTGAISASK